MRRLLTALHYFEDGLLVAVLFLMILLSLVEIVLRNAFGISWIWIEPTLQNGVLWIALLGTMVGSRKDEQIRIDIASHYLSPGIRRWLSVILDMVTAGICLAVAWYSGHYVFTDGMQYDGYAFSHMPSWVLQAIIPVGFAVIGVRYFVLFCLNLVGQRPDFEAKDTGNSSRPGGDDGNGAAT